MTAKSDLKPKTEKPSVELEVPLNTPSGVVSTITFRRGKAKDMMGVKDVRKVAGLLK